MSSLGLPEHLRQLVDRMVDGSLAQEDHQTLQAALAGDPQLQDAYLEYIEFQTALHHLLAGEVGGSERTHLASVQLPQSRLSSLQVWAGWLAASVAMIAVAVLSLSRVPAPAVTVVTENKRDSDATLVEASGAELFGTLLPEIGGTLERNRDYALVGGMMKLRFAHGAETILNAPAVIEIVDLDHLIVKVGSCSVYAPPGAEGFRVTTPHSRIVDLGTRFSVDVTETGETEVHVVEGEAEVDPIDKPSPQVQKLTGGEAFRLTSGPQSTANPIPFNANTYATRLPDRVVSYVMDTDAERGAAILKQVTVQRDGQFLTYERDEFIDAQVTHFAAGEANSTNLALLRGQSRDELLLSGQDDFLNTGIINPGGSVRPLMDDPRIGSDVADSEKTPGIAYRFDRPIVNTEGPDFVIFELQSMIDPVRGDAIHVSPLRFREGLRSISIDSYDITLNSSEAQPLPDFNIYRYPTRITSLAGLSNTGHITRPSYRFHAIAVAVDLSWLGYEPGEEVEGFFLQDALDDDHFVDPVFVGGLPPLHAGKVTD